MRIVRSWMALLHVICPLLWIVAGSNILHMYLRNHCNHYCILNNYQNKKYHNHNYHYYLQQCDHISVVIVILQHDTVFN